MSTGNPCGIFEVQKGSRGLKVVLSSKPTLATLWGLHELGGPQRQLVSHESSLILSLALQDLADQDCNGDMSNLSFYKNEICFQPNGTSSLGSSPSALGQLSILLGCLCP